MVELEVLSQLVVGEVPVPDAPRLGSPGLEALLISEPCGETASELLDPEWVVLVDQEEVLRDDHSSADRSRPVAALLDRSSFGPTGREEQQAINEVVVQSRPGQRERTCVVVFGRKPEHAA